MTVRALILATAVLAPALAIAQVRPDRAVVLVFPRDGVDANLAVRVERDLRNMYDYAHGEAGAGGKRVPATMAIEPRFDVGHISKGELEKSRRHFNDAQRALESGDADEAQEQLFRAERFYNKGIPFASDEGLLRGIFFYYYLVRVAAGQEAEARDAYCAYVALSRNLSGSAGPLEQFEPLADKCGETKIAGTAELRVTADVDGAHVYVDDRAVGVIGRNIPYVDPFIAAGPHLVEVRKAGYLRWGELVILHQGQSQSLRAQLKEARNRKEDFDPLATMPFRGEDAFSDNYIADLLFQMADRYGALELVAGYVEAGPQDRYTLTLFSHGEDGSDRQTYEFSRGVDAHRPALSQWWQTRFGAALDPADALPVFDRWAPTLFKVE